MNTEFQYVGQAYQIGRYPLHFNKIGNARESIVSGCSIHNSYNRIVGIQGTNNLLIKDNVSFRTKGHGYYFANGDETNNTFNNNLALIVERSWSLLNTDKIPSTFWIRHPMNHFIGNSAGGSDGNGFWYDLESQPRGSTFGTSSARP
ncbi:MAG: hypothetical protein COA94_07750 [Rickettsiales bacterium]|nr:MAG: hypothetical protein COA94_07750 [Rickettsiales bacterium]